MNKKYSPSVNIIRDSQREMEYIVTENAEKSAQKILSDFNKGFHSFSIIGSYGTGKSSFLWAFQQSLTKNNHLFNLTLPNKINRVKFINFVGEYNSLIDSFNFEFNIEKDYSSHQKLFDSIFQSYTLLGENGLLILQIDEFGKFLEFAAQNNPEKEMYFIQQLAEFINDPSRNIILLTTLHQGLDSYAVKLADSQKNEWRKVRGRIQEITFNEPVEQLLSLASRDFIKKHGTRKETKYSKSLVKLLLNKHIFPSKGTYFKDLKNDLYPLDIFSAYILTLGLQRYGQNERSLFSFIQSSNELEKYDETNLVSIPWVYDYLLNNYYQLLTTRIIADFSNWSAIQDAMQRADIIPEINHNIAGDILKTIGLLSIFSSKAAMVDDELLSTYFSKDYSVKNINETIKLLVKFKVIRFFKFNHSYKLFEGTDLDIEQELIKVENQVSEVINLVPKLTTHFDFPIVTAKANSYQTGTPRLFEYRISENPISETPVGEIDGFINLIFNTKINSKKIQELTKENNNAILYGFFKNSDKISQVLFEIDKTNQVLSNIEDDSDRVAKRELKKIERSNQILLNHYVLDSLFNQSDVDWVYDGKIISLKNNKELNKQISKICYGVYHKTPIIKNELFNKHKPSGAISSARKSYFEALTQHFSEKDLGFEESKFPPQKTIYYTLLNKSGMHFKSHSEYSLTKPNENSELSILWNICIDFLSSAKDEPKKLTELFKILTSAPYKIKQGVIDFWVPTFLFIKRGDYALYSSGKFKPYVNQQELYLITRTPQLYTVKSFELNDLRLSFFNKYRELLKQKDSRQLNLNSFIESIRPILLTYRELIPYSQNTNRISTEAIQLREAIKYAQDPEKVFFDEFPKALGFNVSDLLKSDENFDDYIFKFQNTIDEIKNSYGELLNRIEKFILGEIIGRKCDFTIYKNVISDRFKSIKEHQLLPVQKTFIQRVNSPLNDRDSWLASVSQALLSKPLTSIEDKDENILKDKFIHLVKELDNLSELDKLNIDSEKEEVFKLDITTKKDGLVPYLVRIPKGKAKKVKQKLSKIKNELGDDKQLRIAILAKLLQQELNNE